MVREEKQFSRAVRKDPAMAPNPSAPHSRSTSEPERRGTRRCKITQVLRARPSNPETDEFEDVRGTLSVSRSGVYFHTNLDTYELGMRLFVTLPYSQDPTATNREYLAEVARVLPLVTGMYGVGIKLLMEIGFQQSSTPFSAAQRK